MRDESLSRGGLRPPAQTSLLDVDDVEVGAGALHVSVDGMRLRPGEVVAILGPNGAGKSTLLQVMAGLRQATRGAIRRAAHTGYLPQRPVMLRGTVRRNVALPARFAGVGRASAIERADEALAALGISHLAGRRATTLSGGEARRVALARVLAPDPDLVFLDEPFDGLDAAARSSLLGEMSGSLQTVLRRGADRRSVVVVTHDPEEASVLADRVVVLLEGRVVQDGPVRDVFARPSDERVAALVGADNTWFGTVDAVDADVVRARVGVLLVEATGEAVVGDEVVLVMRPEVIVLHPEESGGSGSARNRFASTVVAIEYRAHVARVTLDVAGQRLVAVVAPPTVEDMGLVEGSRVTAAIKATAVHAARRRGPSP